jgi:hypothetical protein
MRSLTAQKVTPPMLIEAKLEALGFVLPELMQVSQGLRMPFAWVRVRGRQWLHRHPKVRRVRRRVRHRHYVGIQQHEG